MTLFLLSRPSLEIVGVLLGSPTTLDEGCCLLAAEAALLACHVGYHFRSRINHDLIIFEREPDDLKGPRLRRPGVTSMIFGTPRLLRLKRVTAVKRLTCLNVTRATGLV
jgi:hypothetical protein